MVPAWRRGRGAIVAGLVSVAAISAALVLPGAQAAGAQPAAGTSPALFNRETYSYSSSLSASQEANRYQVMVLHATDHADVQLLKAANPNVKIFMYTNILASNPSDPGTWSECTTYATDNSSHPSWFLVNQAGQRMGLSGYAGNYVMDVGNPAYQQACVAHATALAKQYGFDGVYFDGATANLAWAVPAGTSVPKYPTPASWQAAVYSLLSYATPQVHAQGRLLVANIGGGANYAGLWQKWTSAVDGSEEESWMDTSVSYYWPQMLADTAWSEANGKLAILHSHYATETGNTFGLASMLLVAQGKASYSTANTNYTTSELWFPEYNTAQQLGAPVGPYRQLANGVLERTFTGGLVVVNPTTHAAPSFALGGGVYSGSGLANALSAALAPASGLILLRVATSPPPVTNAPVSKPKPKPKAKAKPKRVRCVVPKLAHTELARAKKLISRAHCRVGKIVRKPSSLRNRHHVLAQRPAAHRQLAAAAKVNLIVGR